MNNFLSGSDFLKNKKQIHFIGIGGSGMYPLAQILHSKGYNLTGSDNNETDTLNAVRKAGIPVFMGHNPSNLDGADLIICSAAIMEDNPELIAAAERRIPVIPRAQLLGLVTSWYDKAICVAGTHGKTTVSSMLTHICLADDIDVSAVIGGKLKAIGGSGRAGNGDIMVCEACEFNDTFLSLYPDISVLLNIDSDHLDYFKTMDNLRLSFTRFCDMTSAALVYNNGDDSAGLAVKASGFTGKRVTFGWDKTADYYPADIVKIADFHTTFNLMRGDDVVAPITLRVAGEHNVLNAVAACAAALTAGCGAEALSAGLAQFEGAGRRFERLAAVNGITVVDDYAHHPAELEATLKTAKTLGFKRVWAVHQPFTYSRTSALLNEFAEALSLADKVTLTEIMGGREKNTFNIYAGDLAEKLPGCEWFAAFEEVADFVAAGAEDGDLIITLGCGDVNKVAHMIIDRLGAG